MIEIAVRPSGVKFSVKYWFVKKVDANGVWLDPTEKEKFDSKLTSFFDSFPESLLDNRT